jgi:protein TonB
MKSKVNNVIGKQSKELRKRDLKKSVTRASQGVLFFQIGLILSLIATIFAMEIKVGFPREFSINRGITIEELPMRIYVAVPNSPKPIIDKPAAPRPKVVPVIVSQLVNIIEDVSPVIDTQISETPSVLTLPTRVTSQVGVSKTININEVEFVPVFPGCESLPSKGDKKACMNSKINAFISKKFKSDRFSGLKKNVTHNIYVQFTIDEEGNVQEVTARAIDKQMELEGVRVLQKLPKMIPGKMGAKSVSVSYMVPIAFKVY